MKFNESLTKQNLAKSFAAECQAGARYQFMATQAQSEQLVYVKDTLKLIAKNEMAHAKLFYDYIVDNSGEKCEVELCADYPYIESSLKNSLKEEAKIEREEFDSIYPEFAKIARDEGFEEIAKSYELVAEVEKTHSEMLNKIYKDYEKQSLYKSRSKMLYKCSNCGHYDCLTEGWECCPLCSLPEGYIAIDFSDIFKKC